MKRGEAARVSALTPHWAVALIACVLCASGCSTLSGQQRPAPSSLGCMQSVVRDRVPAGLSDKHTHCLAAGFIARQCSVSEAYLAGVGKELRDLLGRGDAEWSDLRADSDGVRCARASKDDESFAQCCENVTR